MANYHSLGEIADELYNEYGDAMADAIAKTPLVSPSIPIIALDDWQQVARLSDQMHRINVNSPFFQWNGDSALNARVTPTLNAWNTRVQKVRRMTRIITAIAKRSG